MHSGRDIDHGLFDDVRRSALDRGVDGIPLSEGSDCGIARSYVREVPPASEQGFGVTFSLADSIEFFMYDDTVGKFMK